MMTDNDSEKHLEGEREGEGDEGEKREIESERD